MIRIAFIMLLSISFSAFGAGNSLGIAVNDLTTEWTLAKEVNGVMIYFKRAECNDHVNGIFKEQVLVRMVNTTGRDLRMEWDMEFWYGEDCRTCDPANDREYHYVLDIKGGEMLEGLCGPETPRELKYYIRFLNYPHIAQLSRFELANLNVNLK
ncbi:MAG: hypothetical protein IH599_00920 [Bacteroidales bacterium]|nr:hypothetical protein [Bacteroidales bacterium]